MVSDLSRARLVCLVVLSLLFPFISAGGVGAAVPQTCGGEEITILGTAGSDALIGTPGNDVISGLQGDDIINGLGGDDIICGGFGNDVLRGNGGFDIIFGAQGNDVIYGAGSQPDLLADDRGARMFGGAGNDTIHGTNRWDRMQGGPGADRLLGYAGRDWMRGGSGNDVVDGGAGIDNLHGGNGNDQILIAGVDTVRGGAGMNDECRITAGSDPALLRSCESVIDKNHAPTMWDALAQSGQASQFMSLGSPLGLQPFLEVLENRDGTPSQRTLFAPNNEAMAELDPTVLAQLVNDPATANAKIGYHLLEGAFDEEDLRALDGRTITTFTRVPAFIEVVDGEVVLNGIGTIVDSNFSAENGIVHIIDTFLTPPTITSPFR